MCCWNLTCVHKTFHGVGVVFKSIPVFKEIPKSVSLNSLLLPVFAFPLQLSALAVVTLSLRSLKLISIHFIVWLLPYDPWASLLDFCFSFLLSYIIVLWRKVMPMPLGHWSKSAHMHVCDISFLLWIDCSTQVGKFIILYSETIAGNLLFKTKRRTETSYDENKTTTVCAGLA